MCDFKPNYKKCIVWECVFKKFRFENIEKYKFSNRSQGGAFSKTRDFKGKNAILPNA
jgi:hypothetical protein